VTFPLQHQGVLPAVSRYPTAGPGGSAQQRAGKLPTAGATKALRLKPPFRPASHGCKAPSTNARTAHDPAGASVLAEYAPAARRWSPSKNSPKTPSRANPCPRPAHPSII